MKHATALLLCLAALGACYAQPVYRCGNTYSSIPCPGGQVVEATDPRTAAQRAEARRVASDEKKLAADMRRERLVDQGMQKPAAASSLSAAPAAAVKPATPASRIPLKKKRVLTRPVASSPFTAADTASHK